VSIGDEKLLVWHAGSTSVGKPMVELGTQISGYSVRVLIYN
jgi:hypothetical protein